MTARTETSPKPEENVQVERHEGVAAPKAVYSVHFSREDVRLVRSAARRAGMSTAEWIRQAAVETACAAIKATESEA